MDTVFSHPEVTATIAALLLLGVIGKIMKYSFERIARWYLYASVLAAVVVMNSIFFPFIGGKDYFFRFAVELALMAGVLWWAFDSKGNEAKERVKALFKNPLVITVSVFVLMVVLAAIFAYDASAAFWSNYERGEGAFQMIHYYVFFLLLVFFFRDEKEWKTIFKTSLVAAGLMILYGIMANFLQPGFIGAYTGQTAPSGWFHQLVDGRFQGSLGNPAYVAPYLMFMMFYAGYLWLAARRSGKSRKWTPWLYGGLIAVFFFFFILSQTRGAFLGLGAGVFVFLLYLLFAGRGRQKKWAGVVLALVVLLGALGFLARNSSFVQKLPEGRLLQISLSDATAQTRLWVWGEAWKGFLERPILGWGPENFSTVFDKFFDPRFYVPGQSTETWFDRAHSIYFDYLAETGILGLLSYLAIFGIFAKEFFAKRKLHAEASNVEHALMLALPVSYLVQGVAIFDVFPMYLNLFLFFAFSAYYLNHKKV